MDTIKTQAARSIRQFPAAHLLPDWRNIGVVLRTLLLVNCLIALLALIDSGTDFEMWQKDFTTRAIVAEPLLLLSLSAQMILRDFLWELPLRMAQVLLLVLTGVLAIFLLEGAAFFDPSFWIFVDTPYAPLLAQVFLITLIVLGYFELRAQAYFPAQNEARLQALNARIRPHFLFNSLNAVLSLIRAQPKEAENALEDLSDLFRAALRDPEETITLADEIALGKQYLALEKLRLGDRLLIDWQMSPDTNVETLMPPLLLQPLLENAVRHGIESSTTGGTIKVLIKQLANEVHIAISNPISHELPTTKDGHRIALLNIKERLSLYYDLAARLEIAETPERFNLEISLPCQKNRP